MEGNPVSTLAENLTAWARRLSFHCTRKTAVSTPSCTVIKVAIPTMISVPTIALPNPPPCSKGAGGSCANSAKLSFLPPRQISIHSTANSGIKARNVMPDTIQLRRRLMNVRGRYKESSSSAKSRRLFCLLQRGCSFCLRFGSCSLQHHGSKYVDQQSDRQQYQRGVHQDGDFFATSFGKAVCQQCGQSIRRREQRYRQPIRVTDKHRQCHGFAQRAPKGQENAAEHSLGSSWEEHSQDGLPPCGAESVGCHAQLGRHRRQRITTDRRNRGEQHDGEHDHRGKNTRPA